ncbi:DsbA family protein [Streptomyces sp. NBC_00237]|uniref:thioredoxin domain-containing protein n=1 Tax=Streptomyces sp. NBC_00237 TaxID=2975687 RepID=UPI00225B9B5E|nr:thioredoxin domain-containing protein [Streptomyces sp. NBC_00237]MCX5201799.1 DsbA family protein [Streptomyces sp. NBC_00237]
MSARNNQANKAAARERLKVERERQAKKDKTRRQLVVAGSVVAVLAIAGGVGYFVVQANKPKAWEAAKDAAVTKPANSTGTDGTTVVVGKAEAKKTLQLFEDPRCPSCASFEQANGEQVKKDVDAGKYKVEYVGATFIDNMAGGEGSKNATSALGAALNVSPDAFLEYKGKLYSQANHPEESVDKFADDNYLIKIADQVPALKGNKKFQDAVKGGTFDAWALKMSQKFDASGIKGTPTLKMDGKVVVKEGTEAAPMAPEDFKTAIEKALKG